MSKWSTQLQTHTRDDLLKVCAILARGVGAERIAKDCIQINILGTANGGKSAIVDGITAAFADDFSPYRLDRAPLIEAFPGDANKRDIRKLFIVNGEQSLVTFSRAEFVRHNDLLKRSWARLRHRFGEVSDRGLDFHTTVRRKNSKADIFIRLEAEEKSIIADDWHRRWGIRIRSWSLQTPQMEQALQDLRNFHERRQARIGAGQRHAISGDEPAAP